MKENLSRFGKIFRELNDTVLFAWPLERMPTEQEADDIVSVHDELSLQKPDWNDVEHWRFAGMIVARISRDRNGRNG